jgi:hypothetical protein
MGFFAIVVVAGMLIWVGFRIAGRKRQAPSALDSAGRAMVGAHNVAANLLGSMGGQDAPDFGPAPQAGGLEPEGSHVLMVDAGGEGPETIVDDSDLREGNGASGSQGGSKEGL